MIWNPTLKPKLRPIEPFRTPDMAEGVIGLRDPSGISPVVLTISEAAMMLLTMMDGETSCEEVRRRFAAQFGQEVAVETMVKLVGYLEEAHFLDGDRFSLSSSKPAAVAGYPAITLPVGEVLGLPVGITLFGAPFTEEKLIQYAFVLEQATKSRRNPQFIHSLEE